MTIYLLTNNEYTNLENVSFASDAPTETVQEVLKEKGFKTTLKQLLTELNTKGYKSAEKVW
jgi:hypothetical protein